MGNYSLVRNCVFSQCRNVTFFNIVDTRLNFCLVFNFKIRILRHPSLRVMCPYLEFFWSVFSSNAGKYRPEKLRIRTLFTQCILNKGVYKILFILTQNTYLHTPVFSYAQYTLLSPPLFFYIHFFYFPYSAMFYAVITLPNY